MEGNSKVASFFSTFLSGKGQENVCLEKEALREPKSPT